MWDSLLPMFEAIYLYSSRWTAESCWRKSFRHKDLCCFRCGEIYVPSLCLADSYFYFSFSLESISPWSLPWAPWVRCFCWACLQQHVQHYHSNVRLCTSVCFPLCPYKMLSVLRGGTLLLTHYCSPETSYISWQNETTHNKLRNPPNLEINMF